LIDLLAVQQDRVDTRQRDQEGRQNAENKNKKFQKSKKTHISLHTP
jgi:hypothetical protein